MYAQVTSTSAIDDVTRRDLARRLFRLGALNFDGVHLKTGELSPVYFDIRLTMSDPALLQDIASCMYKMIVHATEEKFDLVTGVPAAAIALATAVSAQSKIPMVLTRKAAKDYGTKKMVEGVWKAGDNVLVVEDVVTYGDSIGEIASVLRSNHLRVGHAVVVVERQQGATLNLLENHNVKLHSLLTLDDIMNILLADGLISMERVQVARNFIAGAQFEKKSLPPAKPVVNFCPPLVRHLCEIVTKKATNTCLSVDMPLDCEELLRIAKDAASRIVALEICPTLVCDAHPSLAVQLRVLAEEHNFLLIADCSMVEDEWMAHLKLSDRSHLAPCQWADIITVHAIAGPGPLKVLRKLNKTLPKRTIGALIIADMTTKDSLMGAAYREQCVELAEDNCDVVVGFVASSPLKTLSRPSSAEGDVVPVVVYKTPSEHTPSGESNGHSSSNSNSHSNGSASEAFAGSGAAVLRTIRLTSLEGGWVDVL